MQFKQNAHPLKWGYFLGLIIFLSMPWGTAFSQTTYLQQNDKAITLLNRLEIKTGIDSSLNFSKQKPFSRRYAVKSVNDFIAAHAGKLTKVDAYNVQRFYMNNLEYVPQTEHIKYRSKKPIFKNFYSTPANLYEVHIKDFDLIVNPVIQYVIAKEKNSDEKLFLNTRGVQVRGRIANKIGFYTYLTDNQERDPAYVRQWVGERLAVPGQGLFKNFKGTGYDYFDARGYITFGVAKYIDITFGFDKNFIGNGYRSLLLSDFGNSNLFLKLNTRIWKLNYQNLFMELQATEKPGAGDKLLPKKYAAMHHLDMNITKWLNIGLFEGIVFGRKDHFDFSYLNPVIFYRSIEQQNGSFDNSIMGLDFKANFAKRFQVYGQLMLDEFLLSEVKKNRGWWANKWGIQLGGKYVDAFGIKNLDLQAEYNRVRPFTYSHYDSIANYTHYNQPLAHPLGANFQEMIGIANYQPIPKLRATAKLIYYQQGRDSAATSSPGFSSFGSNIFLPNTVAYRKNDFGFSLGSGHKTNVLLASFLLAYELRENMFIELNAMYRKQDAVTAPINSANTSVFSLGFRWNMHKREFDF